VYSWQELLEQAKALGGALLVHALMAALVMLGTLNWKPFREPEPVGLTIEAVIVDTSEIKKQRDEARRAQEMEERKQRRDEELRRQREREAAEAEAERQRQQRLEEQRKQEAADRLQALRLERERKLEEERLKQQRELEEIRRQREEAERQRRTEEERLKQLEAVRERERKAEEQRLAAEAEAQRKEAEEAAAFKAGRLAQLSDQYKGAIQNFVTANWRRPMSTQPGLRCTMKIVQIPGGEVISASIVNPCNGDDATRRSILDAVERGGSLPYRGFEDAFTREIEFTFRYDGD
jgi:colicin import membrane protein